MNKTGQLKRVMQHRDVNGRILLENIVGMIQKFYILHLPKQNSVALGFFPYFLVPFLWQFRFPTNCPFTPTTQ